MPVDQALLYSSLALSGALFFWVAFLSVRVRNLGAKHRSVKALSKSGDIAGAVDELYKAHGRISTDIEKSKEAQVALAKGLSGAIQGVGVVRFDAFDDAAGRLSFAVALLDAQGSGVVISTINGRHECRSYAKPVDKGSSSHNLTDEELQAIKLAMG